jgi:hypothetical protein
MKNEVTQMTFKKREKARRKDTTSIAKMKAIKIKGFNLSFRFPHEPKKENPLRLSLHILRR